jgi:hypothetical protein
MCVYERESCLQQDKQCPSVRTCGVRLCFFLEIVLGGEKNMHILCLQLFIYDISSERSKS